MGPRDERRGHDAPIAAPGATGQVAWTAAPRRSPPRPPGWPALLPRRQRAAASGRRGPESPGPRPVRNTPPARAAPTPPAPGPRRGRPDGLRAEQSACATLTVDEAARFVGANGDEASRFVYDRARRFSSMNFT